MNRARAHKAIYDFLWSWIRNKYIVRRLSSSKLAVSARTQISGAFVADELALMSPIQVQMREGGR